MRLLQKTSSNPAAAIALSLPLVLVALGSGACGRGCASGARDGDGAYRPKQISEITGPYKVVNAHEHLQSVGVAGRLLRAMDEASVAKTVIVGSSRRTTHSMQNRFVDYEENNSQMLEAARRWPERFVPFVTIDTDDPGKLDKLRRWIEKGAKGLKLYSGHGEFHTRPLDAPDMQDVYRYCEEHRVPIIFHVNGGRYLHEFEPVLKSFPDLQVICPHFCLLADKPDTFKRLMDAYPRLMTDISFGVPVVMNAGMDRISARPERYRALILAYPDRFLWGSDLVVTRHSRKNAGFIHGVFSAYFAMLSQSTYRYQPYDEGYNRKPDGPVERNGIALPAEVLKKIFETNFTRINVPRP